MISIVFDEIQVPLMMDEKFLRKLGIRGNFLNFRDSSYKNPRTITISNGKMQKAFSLRNETTSLQYGVGSPDQCNKKEKNIFKGTKNAKKGIKFISKGMVV